MKYNKQIALQMYEQFNNRTFYSSMWNYYIGKSDIDRTYKTTDRSNRKVKDNFIKTFIDEEVSFMVGQPITYTARDNNTDVIDDIEYNLENVSAAIDTELATNLLIFGEAYELYYKNDDEFKIKTFNPLNSYCYKNSEGQAELFMYCWKKDKASNDNNTYIEFIDDSFIYHFDENFVQVAEPTPHYFKRCPVGVAELPNSYYDTLYNCLKELQDNYEATMSDWSNEIGDLRLAYLILTGVELDDETARHMKEMGILQLNDADSKAEWLIKNLPSDFYKNFRDIIKEDIYRVSQHIDNQTQVQSNTSGTMLATRLNCLRIKITTQNQALKNCIKTRLKCLFKFLDVEENKNYNFRNIIIKPQLNLPQNDLEAAQIISQLGDKISIQTALERLSFITNGRAELEKKLAEDKIIQKNDAGLDEDE